MELDAESRSCTVCARAVSVEAATKSGRCADCATVHLHGRHMDAMSLLARLGYQHELVGRTPRGRLVLILDDQERAAT